MNETIAFWRALVPAIGLGAAARGLVEDTHGVLSEHEAAAILYRRPPSLAESDLRIQGTFRGSL